jgi:HAMP domain-containing protein
MKWIKTIRFRFAFWATVLFLGMLAAFGGFIYFTLSHSLKTAVDDTLSISASETAAGLNVENGQILIPEAINSEEIGADAFSQRGLTLIVLSTDFKVLEAVGPYRSYIFPSSSFSTQPVLFTFPKSKVADPVRVYILPVLDNGQMVGWVASMQSLGGVQDSLDRLLVALLISGGILLIVSAVAGYFLAARALSPVDNITRSAHRISTENLSARLNLPDTGDELAAWLQPSMICWIGSRMVSGVSASLLPTPHMSYVRH